MELEGKAERGKERIERKRAGRRTNEDTVAGGLDVCVCGVGPWINNVAPESNFDPGHTVWAHAVTGVKVRFRGNVVYAWPLCGGRLLVDGYFCIPWVDVRGERRLRPPIWRCF